MPDGAFQQRGSRRGGDGLGHDIGKRSDEINIVLVVVVLHVAVDVEHTIRQIVAFDDDVNRRDDAVRGIESRQLESVLLAQVIADRRLPGRKGASLR